LRRRLVGAGSGSIDNDLPIGKGQAQRTNKPLWKD
jgi:hypothetical protein